MESKYDFNQAIIDGNPCYINKLNIWDYTWTPTGEITQVIDPLNGKFYNFPVYLLNDGTNNTQFAAGEFSNTIWRILCLNNAEG